MKAIMPATSLNGYYLLWLLKVSQAHLLNMVSIAAHGTRKLETGQLDRVVIPLPPSGEQQEFATRVAELQSIHAQQSTARQKAEAAFGALLGHSFSK